MAFAEVIAAAVDSVVTGTTAPLESVVPVIVVTTGLPPGTSDVTTVMMIGGRGKTDDGKGSLLVEVCGGMEPVLCGAGGIVGNGAVGKPVAVIPVAMGSHAIPPGPTTIVVETPFVEVVRVVVPVNEEYSLKVVGVNVTSVVLEPSEAVMVTTVLAVFGAGVVTGTTVELGNVGFKVGPGAGVAGVVEPCEVLDGMGVEGKPESLVGETL